MWTWSAMNICWVVSVLSQFPDQPSGLNADFTVDPLIAGFEWNILTDASGADLGQIDMTWWMTWFDLGTQESTCFVAIGHMFLLFL